MRITSANHACHSAAGGRRRTQGLTLVEMMVTTAVFILMVVAFVYAQMFGMRYDELVRSKLGASEQSRMSFDDLTSDIRASKIWRVGNGNQNGFTNLGNATAQLGNALQLSLTTDTNTYIRYYFEYDNSVTNQFNGRLVRQTSAGVRDVIANYLTNASGTSMVFYAQDYAGNQVYDYQYKYVISALLEFCQYQYPKTIVGPGYYYDYYRLQLRATSHSPN